MLEYDLVSRPLWRGNDWKRMTGYSSERGDFMKKGNGGIRTVFTAGVLLVLVIVAAWTLKHRKADEPADAEINI